MTTQPGQAPSVAADLLAAVLTDETYPPDVRSAAAQLALIGRAMGNGATWAVIGRTLGISGREAKKRAHGLREKVKRAVAMAGGPDDRGDDEGPFTHTLAGPGADYEAPAFTMAGEGVRRGEPVRLDMDEDHCPGCGEPIADVPAGHSWAISLETGEWSCRTFGGEAGA